MLDKVWLEIGTQWRLHTHLPMTPPIVLAVIEGTE